MKIMIVDDDKFSADSVQNALAPSAHETVTFNDPQAALEEFTRDGEYDLVVSDYKMPGMNGIELLKSVREIEPRTNVIIFTGYADIDNAIDAVNYGAYAFFRKPLDIEDFIETVNRIDDELKGKKREEADTAKLAENYLNLKRAYEDMKKVMENLSGQKGGKK